MEGDLTNEIEVEISGDSIKKPVHTLELGGGDGQVGYYNGFRKVNPRKNIQGWHNMLILRWLMEGF